jgi:hypothetical protein
VAVAAGDRGATAMAHDSVLTFVSSTLASISFLLPSPAPSATESDEWWAGAEEEAAVVDGSRR